ncbi:glycosyltransferase [Chlorobium sp. N1]|uniref:glycosyltransferase n=1 Tax=Chlorobium sp. N1 TaxID=2491138 RepID=UPI00103A36C9|nr:glycosyltransferase [Chlorobium sp. N1]TCD46866.1 glycosyltransferase [Chlorobium sp. N1]
MVDVPLLTISIPTFNRAQYLSVLLEQLKAELATVRPGVVELIVSDNASDDQTARVVEQAMASGLQLRSLRNATNIGSDANIAQCFNEATGRYVLIMGDDDLLVDGALGRLLGHLQGSDYGLVCLRAYGFELDFRAEMPTIRGRSHTYNHPGRYLARIAHFMTLISASVINKSLLGDVDARSFCGENLVQVHLSVMASVRAAQNLYVDKYEIAVKRNNSGGYDHSRVFVSNLLGILDGFVARGIDAQDVRRIERRLLLSYLPFYLFRLRLSESGVQEAQKNFSERFGHRLLFLVWAKPALFWPHWPALIWAAAITLIGRLMDGDFLRGFSFVRNRVLRYMK